MDEVEKYTKELLKRDPNSFDGHRLIGDLHYIRATEAFKAKHPDEGKERCWIRPSRSIARRTHQAGQQGVSMQLARALAAKRRFCRRRSAVPQRHRKGQDISVRVYRAVPHVPIPAPAFQNNRAPRADAEQVLKTAFQNNPKQFGFLTLLAMHYYGQQRRDEMVGVLNQIKTHAKEYDQAYLTVGDFYLRMGDGDSAIREYREGIAKDAKKKSTYQKRVIEVLMRQGKRSEAAELNAQILKDDPNDNDARGLAATFLLDKGDVAKALAELQAVVTRAPDNPVARYNLGRAHAARGECEQARQQFQKAIELRPDYVLARLALAQLQVTRGEFDAALKTAEAILAIDKGNVNARLIESAALMGQKKFGDSRVMLDAMLKTSPGLARRAVPVGRGQSRGEQV